LISTYPQAQSRTGIALRFAAALDPTMDDATDDLKVGKLYRLSFPGIAARVIEPPAGAKRSGEYCYLVRSLILRMRWWVNKRGEPDNIHSPHLIVPAATEAPVALGKAISQH
jgi:hypothetical protein